MAGFGWLLFFLGVGALGYAGVMDTTTGGYLDSDRVHNLGLLSNRVYMAIVGGFTLLAGITLLGLDQVVSALRPPLAPTPVEGPEVAEQLPNHTAACDACHSLVAAADVHSLEDRRLCGRCFARAIG